MPVEHLIMGGGLAGGLIALALARGGRGPGVVLVEGETQLGGNHTWSFHDSDLDGEGEALISDLITCRWPGQQVRFPGHARTLPTGYASITSARFAQVVGARLETAGVRSYLGRRVVAEERDGIRLDDGTRLEGGLVIDARGPDRRTAEVGTGYQKFLGLEVELREPGPWSVPLLMDATVPQRDGYRFMYVLPFSPRRVLVEDTTYSASGALDSEECEWNVRDYLEQNGARVQRVLRREAGVLPLPTRAAHRQRQDSAGAASPLMVGYRGGFFHPVTGYSLPLAVRVALAVAGAATPLEARARVDDVRRTLRGQARFGRMLNRLMFGAMSPAARWTAFERFYRLPAPIIERFYASQSSWADQARMLVGRPPAGMSWMHLVGAQREQST